LTEADDTGSPRRSGGALPDALIALFSLAGADVDPNDVLQRTVDLAADVLGEGAGVTVALGSPSSPSAVASSAAAAQALDAWQVATDQGPSVLATQTGRTIVSADVRRDSRWDAPTAPDTTPWSAVAAPLKCGEEIHGVLTAYLADERLVTPHLVEEVEVLAASVGSLLQEFGLRSHLEELSTDMHRALASRSTIEQAKGIVMAAKHCTADEAFQHLVSLSNTTHMKLREIARQVVESVGG
jgi:transcriptional regulator with GAF, ATPase, and Fis domain